MDISALLKQTITYWAYSSIDGWGVVTYTPPELIVGRWEDKQELFVNDRGQEELSHSIVYLNQDVVLNGYLYLGDAVAELVYVQFGDQEVYLGDAQAIFSQGPDTPIATSGARRIRSFLKSPSFDGTQFLRKIWL